ncbi:N-acetylglutaminylglutamine amidotransferase [Thiomonas sp.]|uniref:N-acetylglutaminylglutamine amidotransferase n=1 Tax=Thiomonas sp. TaxID=2047785 RepID=UPI002603D2E2|nr:N-acetylglutaminylglutamine amidotransferase [Thiomonas sp.]
MCGICGELRFDGAAADLAAVQRMRDALAARGPDHAALWQDGGVAFGHTRLAIIDLSAASDQPMVDAATGCVLVFNGVIYNYRALRAELVAHGHGFVSQGDTEVLLKAYVQWGEDCVRRLDGMFAFALWDPRRHSLLLARDRFGMKPLYLAQDGQRLRFASSLPALLAGGGVDTAIDPVALHHLFSLHAVVPAPRTILRGVRKLPPAHTLRLQPDGLRWLSRYWDLRATRPQPQPSEAEWIEATGSALRAALASHVHAADVPVGVLLSGGLDSSLLVGLLAESARDLRTYSIGFETLDAHTEQADEFAYSDLVAQAFGTRHHKLSIPNSAVLQRLPHTVARMTEPMFSHDVVAFDLLAEWVGRDVKAVLAGQGADEVFAGYFWYARMLAAPGLPVQRFAAQYVDRDHAEWRRFIAPEFHVPDVTAEWIEAELQRPHADGFLDQVLRLDVTTLIVDDPVKRVDNLPMAHALELRVPFLDRALVELAASMPPEFRLRDGGKFPLKAVARGVIPDAVIDRPKGYFPVPALKHVRGPFLEHMRDLLHSRACRERGVYQRDFIDALLAAPEAPQHFTRIQGSKLWHAALLEWWLQTHVDRAPPIA